MCVQVRERDSKSQQLLLTDMFKGAAAKAQAKQQQQQQDGQQLDAAAAAGGAAGSDSEGGSDDSTPCAAPPRPPRDVEDLFGGSRAADQAKAATAGRRGRARVIVDDEDGEQQAGDDMQVDQADQIQQPEGEQDKQQQRQQQAQQQRQQQAAEPMPDRLKDYGAWLAWQKQRWKAGRQERKRRKVEAGRRVQTAAEQEAQQVGWLRVHVCRQVCTQHMQASV